MNFERIHALFELEQQTGVLRWKVRSARRVKVGDVAGSRDGRGYMRVKVDGKSTFVHRIVFAMVNGYLPEIVDHINGVSTDNRPANLRPATRSQNMCNSRLRANSKSGSKGVSLDEKSGKWVAYCWIDGRHRHLGSFHEKSAAIETANAARIQLHGAFARNA